MSGAGWKIALAASLTLNVFVVGAVAGAIGMRARMEAPRPAPLGNPLMRAGDQLSPTQQQAYRARLRAEGATTRPLLQEARQARLDAANLFSQPQFDPAAAAAALAKARTADTAAREKLEGAVVDFATTLGPDERSKLAQGLRQPPRRPGGIGGRRGGGGPGGPGFGPVDGPPPEGGPPPS
jgi:uncharacterized membrane protein